MQVAWEGNGATSVQWHGSIRVETPVVCVDGEPVEYVSLPVLVRGTWHAAIRPTGGVVTVRGLGVAPRLGEEMVAQAAVGVADAGVLFTHPGVSAAVSAVSSDVFIPLDETGVVNICAYGGEAFLKNHMQFGGDPARRALWLQVPRGVLTVDATFDALAAAIASVAGVPLDELLALDYPQLTVGGISLSNRRWNARVEWAERWAADPAQFDAYAAPLVQWMDNHVSLMNAALAGLASAGPPDVALKQAKAELLEAARTQLAEVAVQERAAALVLLGPGGGEFGFAYWSERLKEAGAAVAAAEAEWLAVSSDPVGDAVRRGVMALIGCT